MNGTALVTGAAKRLGRAIALGLAENGYNIALHFSSSKADAAETAAEIKERGQECELFSCDLSRMNKVAELIPAVFKSFPDCNVLINSASVFNQQRFLETEESFFDQTFAINFKAPFFLSRDFAKHCRQGQIINLLDTKISKTSREFFVYTLTKKLLADFTELAAKELAPGIRVNGVCPGLILPPPGQGDDYLLEKSKSIPLQRQGDPDSVVSAILFLLKNQFITGEWIFVDGGEHLK
jgi:pteridine reductase